MNNDNEENSNELKTDALLEELSSLTSHYFPDGIFLKGMEELAQMKDKVMELDSALLDLAETSDFSASELKHVTEEAFRLGDAAGRAGTDVLSYIASAGKAGYDMQESLALAEEALKMGNISGIDSAKTAVEHMKAVLDGFGKSTGFASTINDAIAGISKTGTVDFDTLAEGAAKLAGSAGAAGMSLEEMLGLLSGAYEILGDMDQTAGGESAIFSNLKETYGDARNVYDVLEELSSVWNTMDAPSQEAFAASTAGEGQKEVFAALMDNWKGVESAVSSASDSFGAADAANAVYLDSVTGKTAAFQNQVEQLSSALMNSDILKFFLDLGIEGTEAIDTIVNKFGSLTVLGSLMGGYLSAKNLGRANTDSCPSFNMPSLSCFSWIQGFYGRSCAIHG